MINKKLQFVLIISTSLLTACSANNATVNTHTSPVDGKTTTTIKSSDFSLSYVYPIDKNSGHLGIKIDGGSVIDKKTASIIFEVSSYDGYRSAFFKADGNTINLSPSKALTDFNSNKYGIYASKQFFLSCDKIKKVANSSEVYLRITYSRGYVDYDVSNNNTPGADGFEMIKKIAGYCN